MRDYLTTSEVCQRYGVSAPTIRRSVAAKRFPRPITVGQKLRWRKADLDAWDNRQVEVAQ